MKNLTIKELAIICYKELEKGNADKKILISDDDEGNGYHGLYYHFTPMDKDLLELCYNTGANEDNYKEFVILG